MLYLVSGSMLNRGSTSEEEPLVDSACRPAGIVAKPSNLDFSIYPRDLSVEGYGTYPLEDPTLLGFISNADSRIFGQNGSPDYQVVVNPYNDITHSGSRNISLWDHLQPGKLIVINGYGLVESSASGMHGDVLDTVNVYPPSDGKYAYYLKEKGMGLPGGWTVTPEGGVRFEVSQSPQGAFSQRAVENKAEKIIQAGGVIGGHFPGVSFPTLLGTFKYGGTLQNAYGLVYQMDIVDFPQDIYFSDESGQRILNYLTQEFRFLNGLFDLDYVHEDLLAQNKGMCYGQSGINAGLYIGDPEGFKSTHEYTKKGKILARYMSLCTAIKADLSAVARTDLWAEQLLKPRLLYDMMVRMLASFIPRTKVNEEIRYLLDKLPKFVELYDNYEKANSWRDQLVRIDNINEETAKLIALTLMGGKYDNKAIRVIIELEQEREFRTEFTKLWY